jgi:hypothetical protein
MDIGVEALVVCISQIKTLIANHKRLREHLDSLPDTIETIYSIITNNNLDGKAAEKLLSTLQQTKAALELISKRGKFKKVIKFFTSSDLQELDKWEQACKGTT